MKRILPLFFSALLILAFFPASAFATPIDEAHRQAEPASLAAQVGNVASGMWGTCPWELSTDGTLTVHPGKGKEGSSLNAPWGSWEYGEKIKGIVFTSENGAMVEAPMNCSGLFSSIYSAKIESIDLHGFDTSKVIDMSNMFSGCSSLSSLDVSGFDTFRVRNMISMFSNCRALEFLNITGFDTENVTQMTQMFRNCVSLKSLDLSSFDISGVSVVWGMFEDCSSLSTLNLSSFDTSHAQSIDNFTGCYELTHVIVGEKTLTNLSLHDTKINGHTDWYSQTNKAWYTVEQINTNRRNIADVYTKSEQGIPVIMGGGSKTWQRGSTDSLIFRSSAPLAEFERIQVDGATVVSASYAVREGSTVIELNPVYLSTLSAGKHSLDIVSKSGIASTNFVVTQSSSDPDEPSNPSKPSDSDNSGTSVRTQIMYRLYNPNSGEHFYTASANERDATVLAGWNYEGVGWKAPANSTMPVYRLYSGTDHHYCTGVGERDALIAAGWKYEGIGWYSDDDKGVPLYRQFNPNVQPTAPRNNSGSHNYTTDLAEHKSLVSIGWRDEGIGWYGIK